MSKLYNEYLSLLEKNGVLVESNPIQPITKEDVVIVVDFQNDFVPTEYANDGGRFGVADGQNAFESTLNLIHVITKVDGMVIASKDYHPIDHCSFTPYGGPFPPHCIQGTTGAEFYQPVKNILNNCVKENKDIHVVYKSFMKDTDAFSIFGYDNERAKDRITFKPEALIWSYGYELFSSTFKEDIDSKPDVFSLSNPISASTLVEDKDRAFICGLAFDFCVLDTAIGASICGLDTYIVMDATRAAYIPGVGPEGTGFLSTISSIKEKLEKYNIKLIYSSSLF